MIRGKTLQQITENHAI